MTLSAGVTHIPLVIAGSELSLEFVCCLFVELECGLARLGGRSLENSRELMHLPDVWKSQ